MKVEPKASPLHSPAKDVQGDYSEFTSFMKRLVAVPHSQIKAKLEEEKAAKKKRVSASPDLAV